MRTPHPIGRLRAGARQWVLMILRRRLPLLAVSLHLGHRPHLRLVGILAEFPAGAALAEQVPALVEGGLGGPELLALFLGAQLASAQPGPQVVLGLDELIDPAKDLLVVHATHRTWTRPRSATRSAPSPRPGYGRRNPPGRAPVDCAYA